jgi:hypothetical protein
MDSTEGVREPKARLKRAFRWLRAQYQKRAEEAASGNDRMIERIRKTKGKSPKR